MFLAAFRTSWACRRKVSEGLLSEGAQIDVSNSNPVDTRDAELLQHRRR